MNISREFAKLMQSGDDLALFRQYLRDNGIEDLVEFYFLCCSVHCPQNEMNIVPLVKAILKKFITKDHYVCTRLTDDMFNRLIKHKQVVCKGTDLSKEYCMNIFEEAKEHIYKTLETIYSNFITSKIYTNRHTDSENRSSESPTSEPIDYSTLSNAEGSPIYGKSDDEENHYKQQQQQYHHNNNSIDSNNNDRTCQNELTNDQRIQYLQQQQSSSATIPPSTASSSTINSMPNRMNGSQSSYNSTVQQSSSNVIYNDTNIVNIPKKSKYIVPILDTLSEHDTESEVESITESMRKACIDPRSSKSKDINNHTSIRTPSRASTTSATSAFGPVSASPSNHRVTNSASSHTSSRTLGRSSKSSRNSNHHNGRSASPQPIGGKYYSPSTIDSFVEEVAKKQFSTYSLNRLASYSSREPAPNPYHVTMNNAIPNSVRDSEMQSTTDSDTYSIIVPGRSKEQEYRQKRLAQRMEQGDDRHPPTFQEDTFFKQLIEKLNKIKDDQDKLKMIHSRIPLSGDESSSSLQDDRQRNASGSSRRQPNNDFSLTLRETFKAMPFSYPSSENESQQILDTHCAQVFDSTPNTNTPTNAMHAQQHIMPLVLANAHSNTSTNPKQGKQSLGPYNGFPTNGTPANGLPAPQHMAQYNGYPNQHYYSHSRQNSSRSASSNTMPRSNGIVLNPAGNTMSYNTQVISITVKYENEIPYCFKLNGPNIPLGMFKAEVRKYKKGKSYNYFFKRRANEFERHQSGSPFMLELLEHDDLILPLIDDNMVFAEAKEYARSRS